ncbi:MAG TPA: PE-PPE domain-containing protein [Mycobacterium sp.]|nr:PE-PPE domain-containing protein [Mycobacterium sp.]
MKAIPRSLVMIFVALIAVPVLAVTQTVTTAIQLLAVTGFYMGGTGHPLSVPPDTAQFITDYMNLADKNYIVPATGVAPKPRIPVVYPAQVAPFSPFLSTSTLDNSVLVGRNNLDSCLRGGPCNGGSPVPRESTDTFDVYGFSLSAIVASLAKRDLIADPGTAPADTNFFLIANPMRPNGGILARGFEGLTIPFVGITFYGPAPTNSCDVGDCLDTVDVARQYDFLGGDAPARLDPIAFANSIAAYAQLHGDVPNQTVAGAKLGTISPTGVVDQGTDGGDTTYYLITDPTLPILLPLESIGVPSAALALPDAILRVWIEDKYVRDQSPGQHVQFQIIPIGNPVALVGNMLGAVPVGIDDTVAQATGDPTNRPLGTANVYRPFGVGGPVYDKTTGHETTDSGVPFSGTGSPLALAQPQPKTSGNELKTAEVNADNLGNSGPPQQQKPTTPATPEVTKPQRPLEVVRDSLNFGTHKSPLGVHPDGEGPLKKIVSALTGQRPNTAGETASDAPAAKDDAA